MPLGTSFGLDLNPTDVTGFNPVTTTASEA
jgi:hypothetical protein